MAQYRSGFSLPEMLLVLTLSMLMLADGLQVLRLLPGRARLEAGVYTLASVLSLARSEALRSARPVHVCALHRRHNERHNGCRSGRSHAEPWDQGALVYADTAAGHAGYDRREDLRDVSWPSALLVEAGQARYRLDAGGHFSPQALPWFRLFDPPSGLCARVRVLSAQAAPAICFGASCPEGC